MREIRQSGSEGGGPNPIASPYPYRSYAATRLARRDGPRLTLMDRWKGRPLGAQGHDRTEKPIESGEKSGLEGAKTGATP